MSFDAKIYLKYNPDIYKFFLGSTNDIENIEQLAYIHYKKVGIQEKRIATKEQLDKVWITEIDHDFDEQFYLSEYPDVISFFEHWDHISLKERLFNHYHKYGKIENRYKNANQKKLQETDCTLLSQKMPLNTIYHYQNKLECICLLLIEKEVNNGDFAKFIDRLLNSVSPKESKNIHFKIITNKEIDKNHLTINLLKPLFSSNISIMNLNLSPNEDIYLKELPKEKTELPPYGTKSGPNIMFFRSLKECKKFNTTLLLETDCHFKKNWLNHLKNFVDYSNGFWISGATYDGSVACNASSFMMTHLNGGTSLYATGNNNFQIFMDYAEAFLLKQIKNNMVNTAYDCGIKMFIDSNINNNNHDIENILLWKMINRNYLPNKLIGNFSTDKDKDLDIKDIDRIYNYCIIHKK